MRMIKEAFDNFPSGICYFDHRGIPLMINRVMYRLMFSLTGRDLQTLSDFDEILNEPFSVLPDDRTVWQFQKKYVNDKKDITVIIATDITELYRRKQELEKDIGEQRDMMQHMEKAGENIVSITRNEEILAMKMKIHNDLAYTLGLTRQFIASGCAPEKKAEFIAGQRIMVQKLLGELDNDDETNIFSELRHNAQKLGMKIVFDGELPDALEPLITTVIRECLINTVRHAHGDTVFVKTASDGQTYTATITNNGNAPNGEITEGGGLSSLRRSVEERGGRMQVTSAPVFSVSVVLPDTHHTITGGIS